MKQNTKIKDFFNNNSSDGIHEALNDISDEMSKRIDGRLSSDKYFGNEFLNEIGEDNFNKFVAHYSVFCRELSSMLDIINEHEEKMGEEEC